MATAKSRIVLYQSMAKDPATGHYPSFDQLPLEMLHLGAIPDREGYEVVIIDANLYPQGVAHRMAVEACEGALIFGTTSIMGYMVWDGHLAAQQVRAAHPHIGIIAGGWFPSCSPELFLATGIYDAVCMGQGELTFWDFLQATEHGEAYDSVAGLALWRDQQVHKTGLRAVVGWDQLTDRAAWHLLDIEPYRERQMRPGARQARNRLPAPKAYRNRGEHNYFGISYFSSYGCPEPCAFCCSPEVTGRRWKAKSAEDVLDDLQDLQQRWGFDVVRFQDANWGVNMKRSEAFAQGLLDRDMNLSWNTTLETFSILRYGPEMMDLLEESGLYLACVGAEAATGEMMRRIGKPIEAGDNQKATRMLHDRGIIASLTYIIGFPHEEPESMMATLDQARRIQMDSPSASVHVYPFRPIPGNPMYLEALELGYEPPEGLEGWSKVMDYNVLDVWEGHLPDEVKRRWKLYYQYASFHHGIVRDRQGWMEAMARWRLRTGDFRLPLELKAFHVLDKLLGWSATRTAERRKWIMTSEDEVVTMTG